MSRLGCQGWSGNGTFPGGQNHGNAPRAVHDSTADGGRGNRGDLFRLVEMDGEAVGPIPIVVD